MLGQWRMVTIDDRLPCMNGVCVLPRTTSKCELWPMLLVKALLKVMSITENTEDGEQRQVLVDLSPKERFCFMVTCLTGWHPERCDLEPTDVWDRMRTRVSQVNAFPVVWGNHPQVWHVCVYIYVCVCIYIYIYIYTSCVFMLETATFCMCMCICV